MKYTSKEQLQNYLLKDIDSSFDEQVDSWIESASRYIDNQTNRVFIANDSFQERVYDGTGSDTLVVDDFIELNEVKIDDGDAFDVLEYPANRTPKTYLLRENSKFTAGKQNVKVSAKFGYSENPPADIQFAATVLAAGIINYSSDHKGSVANESIGQYRIAYRNDQQLNDFKRVQSIIQQYRRHL